MVRGRVVVLISILVAPYIYLQSLQFIAPPFWDARIYADAIIRFVHGGSPMTRITSCRSSTHRFSSLSAVGFLVCSPPQ